MYIDAQGGSSGSGRQSSGRALPTGLNPLPQALKCMVIYIRTFVHTHTHIYICIHICIYIYAIHIYAMYICIHIYIYIYIHIY